MRKLVLLVGLVGGCTTMAEPCTVDVIATAVITKYRGETACVDTILYWRERCVHGDSVFMMPKKHCH